MERELGHNADGQRRLFGNMPEGQPRHHRMDAGVPAANECKRIREAMVAGKRIESSAALVEGAEELPPPGENAGVEQREQHAFDAVGVFAHVFKKENAAF